MCAQGSKTNIAFGIRSTSISPVNLEEEFVSLTADCTSKERVENPQTWRRSHKAEKMVLQLWLCTSTQAPVAKNIKASRRAATHEQHLRFWSLLRPSAQPYLRAGSCGHPLSSFRGPVSPFLSMPTSLPYYLATTLILSCLFSQQSQATGNNPQLLDL